MSKWLVASATLAIAALLSISGEASAAERKHAAAMQAGSIDVSAAKRQRSQARVTVRPRYKRYYAYPHPTDLVTYSRPYFVPGPPKHATGFRRDGIGTGAYGFGYN